MKPTPDEDKIMCNFEPGKIAKDGFLGKDSRHVHDIILADQRTLVRLGVEASVMAERLQHFIDDGEKGMGGTVDLGSFTVQVSWTRGMLPCPFGEPGLHQKLVATVHNKVLNKSIRYSQLSVHMIGVHGFFGGEGSVFRLAPDEVVEVIGLQTESPA